MVAADHPTGWTVITTRCHDAALASHGRLVDVGLFSRGEAHAYLRAKFTDHPARLTQADELAADLSCCECLVDLAGDVSLEAADDLARAQTLGSASSRVVLGS